MREIKFRAWFEKGNKMFNVDVLAISPCTWDCPDYGKRGVSLAYQPSIKVMQYTGLKDKNGKEVYEYDIVKHQGEHHTVYGIVRFGEAPDIPGELRHLGFYIEWQNDGMNEWGKWWRSDIIYWLEQESCEVVGNTYENPELIGERHED